MTNSDVVVASGISDPPTYSPWVRRRKSRKRMNLKEINGGPGRTRTFDLPIMSRFNLYLPTSYCDPLYT